MTTSLLSGKISSLADLADAVKIRRKALGLTQADLADLARTGNRFIVDLEKGKPTLQIDKVLAVVSLLGLDLHIKEKEDMLHQGTAQTITGRPRSLKEAMFLGKKHGDIDSFIREFLDEFYVEQNNLTREIMLREEPPLVTEDRTNAYLAAVAE
ncbi:MAG TPA: helix-turn-helix transcriptional regulator, partial [Novimethylophilus sp.]|uniref:helix-turn-helix transcriptional regulator n=1 Tax=Novimethylophilus sp. TaxID=2137426 RepID=UPI002F3EF3F4